MALMARSGEHKTYGRIPARKTLNHMQFSQPSHLSPRMTQTSALPVMKLKLF